MGFKFSDSIVGTFSIDNAGYIPMLLIAVSIDFIERKMTDKQHIGSLFQMEWTLSSCLSTMVDYNHGLPVINIGSML